MRIEQLIEESRLRTEDADMSTVTERDQIVAELRSADKLLLTTHENPDGDALGSLLGMHEILDPARQGLGDVHGRRRVPAAVRVPPHGPRRRACTSRRRT